MIFKSKYQSALFIFVMAVSTMVGAACHVSAAVRLVVNVKDAATLEPLEFAAVTFRQPAVAGVSGGHTDAEGSITLTVQPGQAVIELNLVGYKAQRRNLSLKDRESLTLNFRLEPSTSLNEVVVTAREGYNATSASLIDTTAMRHLQPSSFTDLMSLLPGGVTKDPEMGSVNRIDLRSASGMTQNDDYATAALGTAFVVDGVRLNTDADMQITPDANRTSRISTGKGVDMRSLSTDDIESVEIVRGIPSVEYGELTSGLVSIKRKSGAGRLEARFKADTQSQLFYVGKGFDLSGDNTWIINAGVDYLDSKIDPRNNRENFKRVTGSLRSTKRWTGPVARIAWNSNFSYSGMFEKDDNDPDLAVNNTIDFYQNSKHTMRWDNTLRYVPSVASVLQELNLVSGLSYGHEQLEQQKHVASSRVMPMPVSLVEGDNYIGYLPMLYLADYRVEGRPFTASLKSSGRLRFGGSSLSSALKFGVEWNMSKNYGRGAVYDITRPLIAGNNTRPRAFRDVPAMHQLSAYLESETRFYAGKHTLSLTAGLRETQLLHLDSRYELSGKPYFDPRFNLVWSLPPAYVRNYPLGFELAAGAGWHTKMPVAAYLYPEKLYSDFEQLNYYHNVEDYRVMNVRTYIEDMTNYCLKAARNFKWEVRADISYRGNRLSVTYFRENMTDGFRSSGFVHTYTYNRYDASGFDPYAAGRAPLIEDLPYQTETYLAVRSKTTNGSRTLKEGVEYTLQSRRLPVINTRLTISGAFFSTTNSNSQSLWYKPSIIANGRELQYVGLYDDLDGNNYRSVNTNILFDTDLPRLGLNFSIGVQNLWLTSRKTLRRDGIPVQYMDVNGAIHPYTDECLSDPYLKQLVRNFTESSFVRQNVPAETSVNFKATKTFWQKRVGLAVYVNRLVYIAPDYERYGITIRRYSTPYFGMELNLKI
ncbi:carboxypeptidase-like regulatory domain-containing protein [Duncaniella muris]|uniref:TonB-dependent receptor n=1 Tax=Duncaniella muris TaxID=2094150 RepID=UPI00272D5B9E|nr:carboxypeptidase-like regulatory domain-containing protein [Duncaniella muris]